MTGLETIAQRYVLIRPLAEGGMGQVFLARQVGLDGFEKLVVIKRILPQYASDPDFARLFLDEARTVADLRHANVVTVFDVGVDRGTLFLAMEYLHGHTVRRVLQQSVHTGLALPVGVALQIAIDVARGLDYAHKKTDFHGKPLRIVHRDVSPSNVIVTWAGASKLVDFGVAKAATKKEKTEPGAMVGKIDYMTPEAVAGEAVDARSDQFSLGIVLWEMLTRKRLFYGSDYEILRAIVERPVPPPSEYVPELPPALDRILLKALARRSADRFSDCAELADQLEEVLAAHALPHSHGRVAAFLKDLFGEKDSMEPLALGDELTFPPVPTERDGSAGDTAASTEVVSAGARGNLPAETGSFVGRGSDLDALTSAFTRGERLVTLLGPGGAGKTRLALRYAREHRDRTPVPGGGVWLVDLTEARTLPGVVGALGAALGIPLGAGADPGAAVERVGTALAGRGPMLIVLDNFEQAVEHAPATVGRWMSLAPEARFLVTSRELLKIEGEVVHELEPLRLPEEGEDAAASEAVQLFVERARAVRRGWSLTPAEAPAVAEIVRRLDGMPLAIELAAARMTAFGPAKLLELLSKRFDLLSGARRATNQRQATLRGAIEWSWTLLKPWEAAALAQASVFAGGFDVDAAERVLDLSAYPEAPWIVDVLQSLREKSLLRSAPSRGGDVRFGLYESIREYAAVRLDETTGARPAAEARHAAHYLALGESLAGGVETHGGSERMRRLAPEIDNLAVVHRRALAATPVDPAAVERALRAACALEPLLVQRGPLAALLAMLDAALSLPQTGVPVVVRARALQARGGARAIGGRAAEGVEDLLAAIALAKRELRRPALARLRSDLGRALLASGRVQDAVESLEEALSLSGEDPVALGPVLASLAALHHFQGRFAEARGLYERALDHLAKTGNRRLGTKVLGNFGLVLESLGDFSRAQAVLEQSLASGRALEDQRHEGIVLGYLGVLHQECGRFDEARRHYEEAIAKLREVGDRNAEAESTAYLGVLLHEQGRTAEAQERYEKALTVFRSTGAKHQEGVFGSFLGALHADAGRLDAARGSFRAAGAALAEIGGHLLRAARVNRGHLDLALAAQHAGDEARASRWTRRAERRLREALPSGGAVASDEVRLARRLLGRKLKKV